MTLMSVRVYYVTCDVITSAFASFPVTSSGPQLSSLVAVDGRCVAGATADVPGPRGHCNADGRWVLFTGGCLCVAGHQPSRRLPNVCTGTSFSHWRYVALVVVLWCSALSSSSSSASVTALR